MLCFVAHRSASSRNCSKSRTVQLGLCFRCRDVPVPSLCCTSFIGCQFSNGSHKSWNFWCTKFRARPLQVICGMESRNVFAAELCVHHSSPLLIKPFTRTDFPTHMEYGTYGTPYLFTSANLKLTLPSDVILRRTTLFQPILPPSGPCNAPWFSSETLALYKSLTYLLTYTYFPVSGTGCRLQYCSTVLCLLFNWDFKLFCLFGLLLDTDTTFVCGDFEYMVYSLVICLSRQLLADGVFQTTTIMDFIKEVNFYHLV